MGFWEMHPESGGIDFAQVEKRRKKDKSYRYSVLVMGDGPADTMYLAVCDIIQQYEQDVGRKPTLAELRGCLAFELRGRTEPQEALTEEQRAEEERKENEWRKRRKSLPVKRTKTVIVNPKSKSAKRGRRI